MDSFDYKIIKAIMTNGRVTWAELASQIGLSAPAIADRVNRLFNNKVIKELGAMVNGESVGTECTAFVTVSLERPRYRKEFLQLVTDLEEVQECHHIAGEDDYLLKIRCRNTKDLDRVISYEIKSLAGVLRTRTTIVMDTTKETFQIPLQKDKFNKTGEN
ncbi:Lrp/AsnC family transcriptional regulator [Niallia sp.]|uniref:Lrp/AsnC family transcriptional regulator n=1 Tax=Niallia sp. TaxID=2837523 RepID=UPI00289F9881|nr:Lrp/AsnC family transcriptional regulator [Niallia sp.]